LKLGLTSFGGPIAHLGYFRDELVVRLKWLDEAAYADLVALCQFLPGPASSQVGFSLGILRDNGLLGGLAAWFAFTMPSALILFAFAMGAAAFTGPVAEGFLHGLKLVAVAVVAQAIWGMSRTLTPDRTGPASRLPPLRSWFFSPDRSGKSRRSCSARVQVFGSAGEGSRRFPDI
jgi:chromate transporter